MLASDDDRDWAVTARRDARARSELIGDSDAFTAAATECARTMRENLGLVPDFDGRVT